jgi:Protein of unknown function (DUF3606)
MLRYWSERLGVPKDEIVAAVKRVGQKRALHIVFINRILLGRMAASEKE